MIAEGWAVTAGHCVSGDEDSPGQFRVKAGVFDESSSCVFLSCVTFALCDFQLRRWRAAAQSEEHFPAPAIRGRADADL